MIYLFCVGKFQFSGIRIDLSLPLPCLFNSQTIAPSPLFLHINQPLGDQALHIHRPLMSYYLCLTCSVYDVGEITNIFCKMKHLI